MSFYFSDIYFKRRGPLSCVLAEEEDDDDEGEDEDEEEADGDDAEGGQLKRLDSHYDSTNLHTWDEDDDDEISLAEQGWAEQ